MVLTIALLISLSLNFILFREFVKSNKTKEEKNNEVEEMKKRFEFLDLESSKSKEVSHLEREKLIAERDSYLTQLKDCKRKLQEFSEEKRNYYKEMDYLNNFSREMSPEEFVKIAKESFKKDSNLYDFTGIYILENKTHDKFYVGQSISLFKRVYNHFTGKGNKDIFEDYSNGDVWTIKLISLSGSGFKSINALEKHFIEYHHATYNGYNKTIGNANWLKIVIML